MGMTRPMNCFSLALGGMCGGSFGFLAGPTAGPGPPAGCPMPAPAPHTSCSVPMAAPAVVGMGDGRQLLVVKSLRVVVVEIR